MFKLTKKDKNFFGGELSGGKNKINFSVSKAFARSFKTSSFGNLSRAVASIINFL